MTRIQNIFILFFFLCATKFLIAQVTSLEFERISLDQGLSNNSINSILQTSDGFLWIATKDGLNRFDGKTFKIFKQFFEDSTSLPQNYVMSLYEDNELNLWVGTWGGGLCKYSAENENFTSYNFPGKQDDYVQCLFEDDSNNIWIGTLNGGLNKLKNDKKSLVNFSNHTNNDFYFPSDNITYVTQTDTSLWIGTWDKGLFQLNLKNYHYVQFLFNDNNQDSSDETLIWDIHKKSDNIFLLSTNTGIIEFNNRNKHYSKFHRHLTFRKIIEDSKGRTWAGTYNYQGIYLFDDEKKLSSDETILKYSDDDPFTLTSDRVRWLYQDNLKNIWVGTEDGLNKLPQTKEFYQFKYFPSRSPSIAGRVVSSIVEGKNNILWVGYGGAGFNKINLKNNTLKHYSNIPNNKNSLSADDVVTLFEDSGANLWIGTSNGGLNKYNPNSGRFTNYMVNPNDSFSIKSNWVHQIIELDDGKFLVGTNESLELFDSKNQKFNRFSPELSSKENILPNTISVNALLKDSQNNIWIGTWLDGLFMYDSDKQIFKHYMPEKGNRNSISSNKIISIFEDSNKQIWIGTHSGGLNKMNSNSRKIYTLFNSKWTAE